MTTSSPAKGLKKLTLFSCGHVRMTTREQGAPPVQAKGQPCPECTARRTAYNKEG